MLVTKSTIFHRTLREKLEHFKPSAVPADPADPTDPTDPADLNRKFLSVALDECVQGSEVSFSHFLRINNISE